MRARKKGNAVTTAILVVALAALLFFFVLLLRYVITGTGPALGSAFSSCKEIPIVKSPRMAIIRLDDVQAYSLEDVAITMMDDAKKRGIPLVLGVIPQGIGDQRPVRTYLEENACWLEIAQHGWDHQGPTPDIPEFRDLDRATAAAEIARGKPLLEALAGEPLLTFIPPQNAISDGARQAVAEAGMRVISSEGTNEFDYSATTFDFLHDTISSANAVVSACNKRIAQTPCVVMTHPQDFLTNNALDPVKYQVYLDTLDGLKAAGYTFVRFKDIVK